MRRALVPLAAAAVLVTSMGPSWSTIPTVVADEYSFTQDDVTQALAGELAWYNQGALQHTATTDVRGFFNTGVIDPLTTDIVDLKRVGAFPYHCTFHPRRMQGIVRVPLTSNETLVPAGTRVRFFLESQDLPRTTFDVQRRRDGGRWRTILTDVERSSVRIRVLTGVWDFRARAVNRNGHSRWSPFVQVTGSDV